MVQKCFMGFNFAEGLASQRVNSSCYYYPIWFFQKLCWLFLKEDSFRTDNRFCNRRTEERKLQLRPNPFARSILLFREHQRRHKTRPIGHPDLRMNLGLECDGLSTRFLEHFGKSRKNTIFKSKIFNSFFYSEYFALLVDPYSTWNQNSAFIKIRRVVIFLMN